MKTIAVDSTSLNSITKASSLGFAEKTREEIIKTEAAEAAKKQLAAYYGAVTERDGTIKFYNDRHCEDQRKSELSNLETEFDIGRGRRGYAMNERLQNAENNQRGADFSSEFTEKENEEIARKNRQVAIALQNVETVLKPLLEKAGYKGEKLEALIIDILQSNNPADSR